jgi:hypothetical protein
MSKTALQNAHRIVCGNVVFLVLHEYHYSPRLLGTVSIHFIVEVDGWAASELNGAFSRTYSVRVVLRDSNGASVDASSLSEAPWCLVTRVIRSCVARFKLEGIDSAFSSSLGDHCERIGRTINAILPHHGLTGRGDGK